MSKQPSPQEVHLPRDAVFTVGHSTLPIERFIALLKTYDVERLGDIRTVPRSRHNPQFNDTAMADSLTAGNLEYVPMPGLGGPLTSFAHVEGLHIIDPPRANYIAVVVYSV